MGLRKRVQSEFECQKELFSLFHHQSLNVSQLGLM
jgi:hypothetical protein